MLSKLTDPSPCQHHDALLALQSIYYRPDARVCPEDVVRSIGSETRQKRDQLVQKSRKNQWEPTIAPSPTLRKAARLNRRMSADALAVIELSRCEQ